VLGGIPTSSVKRVLKVPSDAQPTAKQTSVTLRSPRRSSVSATRPTSTRLVSSQLVDGRGRPLAILLTPGQAGDAPMMLPLLAHLRVQRTIGRPRTRPDRPTWTYMSRFGRD
jgi:hypothetical protein